MQLWLEHFDLAIDTDTPSGRTNFGVSPGDAYHAEPYVYIGPWSAQRPGDPAFWNASFGATLAEPDVRRSTDALATVGAFLHRGLELLGRAENRP